MSLKKGLTLQDPGDSSGTGPGWLQVQWTKIDNLTDARRNSLYTTADEARGTGGGFGLQ